MSAVQLILTLMVLVAVVLAAQLLRAARSERPALPIVRRAAERLASYKSPFGRSRDELRRWGLSPDLPDRQGNRSSMQAAYAHEVRRDFMTVWGSCRYLAPVSQDPDFVAKLVRAYAEFHGRYALMRLDILFRLEGRLAGAELGSSRDSLIALNNAALGVHI